MENTSDSLMPRPLLLCLKSEKIVCYSVPDNSLERFYRKGVCVIDNAVKTIQKKNGKCGIGNRGKTKIVVKEHFSEKGKTMEELLTDVMLEKAKQTIA